jgi:hypothetical protein
MASATFMTIANRTVPMGARNLAVFIVESALCTSPEHWHDNSSKQSEKYITFPKEYSEIIIFVKGRQKKSIIQFIFESMGHCLPLTIGLTLPRAGFLESFYHTDMSSFLKFTEMNPPNLHRILTIDLGRGQNSATEGLTAKRLKDRTYNDTMYNVKPYNVTNV